MAYDKAGADELVFLDITASSDGRNTVVDMVRKVARTDLYSVYRRRRNSYRG